VLSVLAVLLTIIVMWSEAVVPLQTTLHTNISIVEMIVHNHTTRFVGSVIILYYMAASCYWAIYKMQIFDVFIVVAHVSDAASLCFAATFLTRLLIPLCYNFLFVADLTGPHTLVTYSRLFGNMDVVAFLGEWFNRIVPIFIPILAVLIELGVIHRLLTWIGVEGFETGKESAIAKTQQTEEGRALVAREFRRELEALDHSTGGSPVAMTDVVAPAADRTTEQKKNRYADWKAKRGAEQKDPEMA
jgi:hypothetical protein